MDDVGRLGQDRFPQRFTRLLDLLEPAKEVRAIDAAIQKYWEAENWITARAQVFPGLAPVRGVL